jgi:hypothetical protein
MFSNSDLVEYLKTSNDISLQSVVIAEWNMNVPGNIKKVGNYRYRPNDISSIYKNIPNTFDLEDSGDYYTNAELSYEQIQNTYNTNDTLQLFQSLDQKKSLYYSLEDCLKPFRPRSGINKMSFFDKKYIPTNVMFGNNAPRYYMSSRNDIFKYWSSYRKENGTERGIANKTINGINYIEDSCPFVVYKESVPCNRIVVKMQTNVGQNDPGNFQDIVGTDSSPFYGNQNKTIPNKFKVQILKNNNWIDILNVDQNSRRLDDSDIIGPDGYLELSYLNNEWFLKSESVDYNTSFVTKISDPIKTTKIDNTFFYNEFDYIDGIRVVVLSMNKFDSVFDLIEMSPRLSVNISNNVLDFQITKTMSDMSQGAIPVGQLLASNGTVTIFDEELAFNENNENSIIKNYLNKNIKFVFYENIYNDDLTINYFIPIKTLYSDNFPQATDDGSTISISLRDFYFYFESQTAPRMLLTDVSLSFAISTLLDSVGFSNYTFKRIGSEKDPIIPYFFIAPDQSLAQVLNELAVSTQTAMFFDEYNNFTIMSKNYIMPEAGERDSSFTLVGTNNQQQLNGITNNQENLDVIKNKPLSLDLPNIISISSQDKKIYNDGKINYTSRYIQRSYGSIKQSTLVDKEKTWIYKPSLLWEASGEDVLKTINSQVDKQSSFVLGAVPINSDLSISIPSVSNGSIINNTVDLGENVYWLTKHKGYFYSSGEVIRYDAVQFNVTGIGNVWISGNQEYQEYMASLPFNGKIYPTGLIRILANPYYETIDGETKIKNGPVFEHGRGQFGTLIASHTAGISNNWTEDTYLRGCNMKSNYLFTTSPEIEYPIDLTVGAAGVNNTLVKKCSRTGIIKNFMTSNYLTETELNSLQSTQTGTIQSSALVMSGPSFSSTDTPVDFISYVYKPLDSSYKHFGTRMRIVGSVNTSEDRLQTPIGSTTYYQVPTTQPNQSTNIGGGSGGLGIMINPETNNGYYFEIIALSEKNIESYLKIKSDGSSENNISNIVFYKIKKDSAGNAIPIKLWSGLTNILVDDGRFTGQYRMSGEENPTVYDLAVEHSNVGTTRKFYLYINNKLVGIVDDTDPLPVYNNVSLFVRGSSKCMFENIYALNENYSQNTVFNVADSISSVFGANEINANSALRKYAMSGVVQSTYLEGISSLQPPKYNMYYDEFGSIFREVAYFNVKYDKAYPALYAKISPTPNTTKGYVVSGFQADSYGAEFLVFNATDSALNLDETGGNYLKIQGITFTQDTTYTVSVDDYFNKKSNFAELDNLDNNTIRSNLVSIQDYNYIKQSRLNHGISSFTLETPYIQTLSDAENILGWIVKKSMKPKKLVGAQIFSLPILQLGDVVQIDYNKDGVDLICSPDKQFVIYNMDYQRNSNGPSMTVYLAEV